MNFLDDLEQWWNSAPATRGFPRKIQLNDYSCAARCTQMALAFYGKRMPFDQIVHGIRTNEDGTYMTNVAAFLRRQNLKIGIYRDLKLDALRDKLLKGIAIVDVDGDHVAMVHDIDSTHVHIADPSVVRCYFAKQTRRKFRNRWSGWTMIVSAAKGRTLPSLNAELDVRCPVSRDIIKVPFDPATYLCPDCNGDIEVGNETAFHEDICRYTCPATDREDIVWESDWKNGNELKCEECLSRVRIEVGRNRDVTIFHELNYK
jgi:predicted double-glycine peptidase